MRDACAVAIARSTGFVGSRLVSRLDDGDLLTSDYGHLLRTGAQYFGQRLAQQTSFLIAQ
jgi:hypothetical protein